MSNNNDDGGDSKVLDFFSGNKVDAKDIADLQDALERGDSNPINLEVVQALELLINKAAEGEFQEMIVITNNVESSTMRLMAGCTTCDPVYTHQALTQAARIYRETYLDVFYEPPLLEDDYYEE